jgi:hypothetical protein
MVMAMLLSFLLLVMLVDGEADAAGGDGGGDLLLHPVRPRILRFLLRLVLLVHGVCSGGDGAELGKLLHVLVVLLLLAVVAAGRRRGLVVVLVVVPHFHYL